MKTRNLALAVFAAAALSPAVGSAHSHECYYDDHHNKHCYSGGHYQTCGAVKRSNGTKGAVIGGVGGATVGGLITHGSPLGIILGGGAGAVAGHEVAKSSTHC
jgi:outer membrane lipoprotein SlyB